MNAMQTGIFKLTGGDINKESGFYESTAIRRVIDTFHLSIMFSYRSAKNI